MTSPVVGTVAGGFGSFAGQILGGATLETMNWGSVLGAAAGGALAGYAGMTTQIIFRGADSLARESAARLIGIGPTLGLELVGGAFWSAFRPPSAIGPTVRDPGAPDSVGPAGWGPSAK